MSTPKKLNIDGLATLYVNRCFAKALPDEALKAALDALILWKGLRVEYQTVAAYQLAVTVRPDGVAEHLPEQWATLSPDTRKKLRNAINQKAAAYQQALKSVLRFIDTQAGGDDAGSQAFKQVFAEREAEYLTQPIP